MTIAVTPFDGLCGFKPLAEITHFLKTVPPLKKLVGDAAAREFETAVKGHETSNSDSDLAKNKKALQSIFSALMNSDKKAVAEAAKELVELALKEGESFAGNGGPSNGGSELAELVVRLNGQFEGDIGLFVLFFLNYVKLEIGEAMFLKADDIHAYLSGGESSPVAVYRTSRLTIIQISSNVWHLRTTLCELDSRQSIRIFRPLPACSPTPTLPYPNRR